MGFRLFKATYKGRGGETKESAKWYVEFRDHNATVRRLPAFASKPASDEMGRNLVKLVDYHKATGGQTDPALSRWLAGLPARTRDKLVAIGLLDHERVSAGRPLTDHLADWSNALAAKGNTEFHVSVVTGRARKVLDGCRFRFFADIDGAKVSAFLGELRADVPGRRGKSAQTYNFYLSAVKQFCRWMVRNRRATTSPVGHLEPLNVRTDRRRDRRALTVEELRTLMRTTAAGPTRHGLSGTERALLYRFAVETGLRAGEIRSLTAPSFDLGDDAPTVTVAAAYSKRRREDTLPLRLDLAAELRAHFDRRQPTAPAFKLPKCRKDAAKMFRADVEAAGIAYRDEAKRVADFHALRHTFISNLARGGVHPRTAQALARHSTITLTMDRYAHSVIGEQAVALNVLPDLSGSADGPRLARCLASQGRSAEANVDGCRLSNEADTDDGNPAEVPGNQGKCHEVQESGSVWESNPLAALLTPPAGFEDQGQHQLCKHPRRSGHPRLPLDVQGLVIVADPRPDGEEWTQPGCTSAGNRPHASSSVRTRPEPPIG